MTDSHNETFDLDEFEAEMTSSIEVEEVESAYAAIVTCDKGICPF